MLRTKRIRNATPVISLILGLLAAGSAQAFDHLEITVVNPHVVAGRPAVTVETEFSVNVRAVNADGTTDVNANFIHAQLQSPDVAAVLPAAPVPGRRRVPVRQHALPGRGAAGAPARRRRRRRLGARGRGRDRTATTTSTTSTSTCPAGDKFVDQAVHRHHHRARRRRHRGAELPRRPDPRRPGGQLPHRPDHDRLRRRLQPGRGHGAGDLLGHRPGDPRERADGHQLRGLPRPGRRPRPARPPSRPCARVRWPRWCCCCRARP